MLQLLRKNTVVPEILTKFNPFPMKQTVMNCGWFQIFIGQHISWVTAQALTVMS